VTSPATRVHRHVAARLHADERRAEVVAAAVTAFAVGGYAGTSTEQVARLAGVSQPYLFRLFGSKQALFLAAVHRAFERVSSEFAQAAKNPKPVEGFNPVLVAIGNRYAELLEDRTLLRMQLHAYAASSDPTIRDFVRGEFAGLIASTSALSGVPVSELHPFFAQGMLMNVAAALELLGEPDVAWDLMCKGGVSLE
jgi:AcrR family transcriptional regulator